jgi:hypothetical protein
VLRRPLVSLVPSVYAGCCPPRLRSGPSRHYPCRSSLACLDLYSSCHQGAHPFLPPRALVFNPSGPGRRLATAQRLLPLRKRFRSCSHLLRFRPANLLALRVVPTLALSRRAASALSPAGACDRLEIPIRCDGRSSGVRARPHGRRCSGCALPSMHCASPSTRSAVGCDVYVVQGCFLEESLLWLITI